MTTKTLPVKKTRTWPLERTDIHYDPAAEEVLIQRDKFDAFVKYVQTLEERLEAAEDARDLAEYRARKAGKTADLLEALTDDVLQATTAVRDWLSSGHTLQELSARTGIPYATCHRIVNERFGTGSLEIGHLEKILSALGKAKGRLEQKAEHLPRFERVFLGLAKKIHELDIVSSWESKGSEVTTVHTGLNIAKKVEELHPDLIVLDVAMPNLEKGGLEQLKQFAKNKKGTIILTGEIAEANSTLLQCAVETKSTSKEARPTKHAGE